MASSTIKKETTTFPSVTIESGMDFPLIFNETGNDDYKGIHVYDKNSQLRYELLFANGDLRFISYDSNGTQIKNVVLSQ